MLDFVEGLERVNENLAFRDWCRNRLGLLSAIAQAFAVKVTGSDSLGLRSALELLRLLDAAFHFSAFHFARLIFALARRIARTHAAIAPEFLEVTLKHRGVFALQGCTSSDFDI